MKTIIIPEAGKPPRTCPIVCVCNPRYHCRKQFDEWFEWWCFLRWLQTDGPGRKRTDRQGRVRAAFVRALAQAEGQGG